MKNSAQAHTRYLALAVGVGALLSGYGARADDKTKVSTVTQNGAQAISARNFERGSDDSIDECTQHAMKAVMNLASLNIGGAVSEGYHAVGNYLNSDKMDKLQAKNKRLEGSLTSAGAGAATGGKGDISGRSLSERDTYFLYRGKTAEVAAEFEQKTGMKRDVFYSQLASGIDAKYSFDDPKLLSKLEARYEAFKSSITNEDFKGKLNAAEALIPAGGKLSGLRALKEFIDKEGGPEDEAGDTKLAELPGAPAETKSEAVATNEQRAPAATDGAAEISGAAGAAQPSPRAFEKYDSLAQDQKPLINLKTEGGLEEYLRGADAARADTSLFEQISRRYRVFASSL